jgi:hypothetical protein
MIVPQHFLRQRWESWLQTKHRTPRSADQAAWDNMKRMADNHKKMNTLIWEAWENMKRLTDNHKKMSTLIWDASALVADMLLPCFSTKLILHPKTWKVPKQDQ